MKMTENRLFNEVLKERFLNQFNEMTQQNYRRIFLIVETYESDLKKDICFFTIEEIKTVLFSFEARNRGTVESYARIISSYLNWCVEQKFIEKNVLADFKPNDFDEFVMPVEFITERTLRRIEDFCENYQDAVILRLLFIGAGGKRLSEIRNLKKQDVDFKNKRIRLINSLKEDNSGFPVRYTARWIDVDDRTLQLIDGAINQKQYTKRNGNIVFDIRVKPFVDLVKNDYVIRPSITNVESYSAPVDKYVIYRRIQMIEDTYGLKKFNSKFIQRSGMLYYASNIMMDDQLTNIDIKIVAERFGIRYSNNIKSFLTMENIRSLYPK
ncbi:MAG: hypothetical protein C6W56_01735 [Caldibacillus debilis]|nr:MAG: hypothetical protein C6W56_01735 [Caldibacillus debilis]